MTVLVSTTGDALDEFFRAANHKIDSRPAIDSEPRSLSGGTYEHSLIISNLIRELGIRVKGSHFRVLESNLRLRAPSSSEYLRADLSVIYGMPQFDPRDSLRATIVNPRMIVEVLSEATESYDRGRKFAHYRQIKSLDEYILVWQSEPMVETYVRQPNGSWIYSTFNGLTSNAQVRTPHIDVPLYEIYDGIAFPGEPTR